MLYSLPILREYFRIIIFGTFLIIKKVLIRLLNFWRLISFADRFLLVTLVVSGLFLIGGWRSYHIVFSHEYTYFHRIATDDLVLFVSFKGLVVLSVLLINFFDAYKWGCFLRVLGTLALLVIYGLNYFYPERISLNKETQFTWQFYLYGLSLLVIFIIGLLGMTNHTQKDRRTAIARSFS